MGVFTYENDTTSTVPPANLFKAVVHDADIILRVSFSNTKIACKDISPKSKEQF